MLGKPALKKYYGYIQMCIKEATNDTGPPLKTYSRKKY